MEKDELKLLNRIFQDAQIGMQSIDKVLKKLEDESMKKLFKKQFESYNNFSQKCEEIAINENVELTDNNMLKKLKQTAMIYISLWTNKTPRHIVEMMITGTVMGIIDAIKAEKDLASNHEGVNLLVVEFKKMQEDFYEKLKKMLSKV